MTDLVVRKPEMKEYLFVKYIRRRIEQNKNFLAPITGQTGSGKSWAGLSICEMIDPTFSVDRVVFGGEELMRLINSDKLPKRKGVTFLFDEAGIDLSNRNWQSMTNKMINFLFQTFRHRCFILLFTAPYIDFVDSSTRKLFHGEMKTISINFTDRTTKIKPLLLQYNPEMKKFYKKFLRVATGKGVVPLNEWNVPAPSKKLVEEYERKKTAFTTNLNRGIELELKKLSGVGDRKPLTEFQQKIKDCWDKGILKLKDISKETGKVIQHISINEGYMRRKGYDKPVSRVINSDNPPVNLTVKNGAVKKVGKRKKQ